MREAGEKKKKVEKVAWRRRKRLECVYFNIVFSPDLKMSIQYDVISH